jgi:AcrR family transcriptional regulator
VSAAVSSSEAAEPIRVPRTLSRGRHSPPREVVLVSQRERLLEAVVAAVAEKGYASTSVADVLRLARVSRATFYEQFADKEDCFLAAYDAGARLHARRVVKASRAAEGWFDQLQAGTRAYLEVLAEEPAYARTFLIDIAAVGQRGWERRASAHQRYVDMLRQWHELARRQVDGLDEPPAEIFSASVAAVNEVVAERVREGRAEGILALERTIMYIHLSLFGLPQTAAGLLRPD